ncbi:2Fe-2S iron-sulfur cluster-binding protein [Bradyrhizobium elkanii]|uniref:Sarcosine oxidase subunit alpha n=1 Tax=Bradyrhizobium elkanii TaxID=29448 RepID=A0A8I1YGM3_BRAEL|nr:2Fe-2S iron-sulfur cluster-binding protein [Bradyrhizobium elkanii]MBP1299803.1 sarcosine oxidase subunit alpha [Bradyrhizobium elkanii]
MMQPNRLPAPAGLLIDRTQPMRFTFEDRTFEGYRGDTIASALAAGGQWILSRSFKYHRPRGVFSMAGHDTNALVQLPGEPNVPADATPIVDGLVVTGQNYDGSLESDRNAILDRLSRFLPVGFYYRTFIGPGRDAWTRLWEPIIRRKSGLGRIDVSASSRRTDKMYLHKDVVVVGGGPAGLSAALAAGEAGADVLLVDDGPLLGGSLAYGRFDPAGTLACRHREALTTAISALPNITIMTGAVCTGWFADNWLSIIWNDRLYKTRARDVVLATGSIEQPAVFRNNDLPGIMLGSAAQRLIRLYGIKPGQRAVVFTAGPQGYGVALDLTEIGVEVGAVVDMQAGGDQGDLAKVVRDQGTLIMEGHAVQEARGLSGNRHLRSVRAAPIAASASRKDGRWLDCDLLCLSVGEMPAYHLALQSGGRLVWDAERRGFLVSGLPARMTAAGAVLRQSELEIALAQGRAAGLRAAAVHAAEKKADRFAHETAGAKLQPHTLPIFPHPKGKEFVDFDEDLQIADIRNTVAEGYRELELVKRFSTVGMGPSQGRFSAWATAHLVAEMTGRGLDEVGVTTARPPVVPEKLSVLAGPSLPAQRLTPMHFRHVELGARMVPAGAWRRPAYYGPVEQSEAAIAGEVAAARTRVMLLDVSPEARIELHGADSLVLLEHAVASSHADQAVGSSRDYLMLNEIGSVIDDGQVHRVAEDRYLMASKAVASDMLSRSLLALAAKRGFKVSVTDVTAASAAILVRGPHVATLLGKLAPSLAFSSEAFPKAAFETASIDGLAVGIFRRSTGDQFELRVSAAAGEALWDRLLQIGTDFGLKPGGVSAANILRLEDGLISAGLDTDALSTPAELGLERMIGKHKTHFVGARSLIARQCQTTRRELVRFSIPASSSPRPEAGDLVMDGESPVGRVTSLCNSPSSGSVIGFAYRAITAERKTNAPLHIRLCSGDVIETRVSNEDNLRSDTEEGRA